MTPGSSMPPLRMIPAEFHAQYGRACLHYPEIRR